MTLTAPTMLDDPAPWLDALAYDYRALPVSVWALRPNVRPRDCYSAEESLRILENGRTLAAYAYEQALSGVGLDWWGFAAYIEAVTEDWAEALTELEGDTATPVESAALEAPATAVKGRRGRPRKSAA